MHVIYREIFTDYFSLLIEVEFCQILDSDDSLYRPMLRIL